MARNGSGTYSRVNTFIAGATITAAGHNQNWADLENEMTNSVAADGQTTMTGPLKAANGSVAAPSITFGSDQDTGFYRKSANVMGVVVGGTEVGVIGSTGFVGLGSVPIGSVQDFAGATAPTGWLLCYGQSLLRADYPDLFTAIGTAHGAADATHFSLPDYRGRVGAGKGDMGGSDAGRLTSTYFGAPGTTLGSVGGLESHTLTTAQLAVHSHNVLDPNHTHTASSGTVFAGTGATGVGTGGSGPGGSATDMSGFTTSSAATGITIQNNGSGNAHNNVQPTIVVNKIIFTGVA